VDKDAHGSEAFEGGFGFYWELFRWQHGTLE